MRYATVITDASHCGETDAAGWAAYIRVDGQRAPIKAHGMFRQPVTDSTKAEMLASINGLWLAEKGGAETMLLQTDCLAVVNLINGNVRDSPLRMLFIDACEYACINPANVRARHVRGHTQVRDARSHVNRWCDRYARKAMRRMRAELLQQTAPRQITPLED